MKCNLKIKGNNIHLFYKKTGNIYYDPIIGFLSEHPG